MQIWAESGKSALPICNYSQILYQFLTFTQNLKRSPFALLTLFHINNAYLFYHFYFFPPVLVKLYTTKPKMDTDMPPTPPAIKKDN